MLYGVDVTLGDDVTLGRPQPLFRARARFDRGNQFDVSADGQTFLINSWMEDEAPRAMSVILNWTPPEE